MKQTLGDSPGTAGGTLSLEELASEFAFESDLLKAETLTARRRTMVRRLALIVGAVAVLALSASTYWWWRAATDASLRIESEPAGAEVRLNGELRGTTPLVLTMAPGSYSLMVGQGDGAKERRITVGSSERASIYQTLAPQEVS